MRGALSLIAKLLVTAGLVGFFLWKIGPEALVGTVRTANFGFLVLSGASFLLSNILGAYQWRVLLRGQDIHLPFREVLALYFVGVFFNNFLISNMGGDVIRAYQVRKASGHGAAGLASILLDRFVGLLTLICLALGACFFTSRLEINLFPFMLVLLGGLVCLLAIGFSERLAKLAGRVIRRIMPKWIRYRLLNVHDALILYRSQVSTLGLVFLISLGVQIFRVGVYYGVGLALNVELGFHYFLVIIPVAALAASIPISFGGIGIRENVGVFMLGPLGVLPTTAFSLLFLGYIVGVVASLPGGLIFLLKQKYRAPRHETATPDVQA